MLRRDPKWQMHRIPPWLRKAIKAKAILDGKWDKRMGNLQLQSLISSSLFDHWGQAKRDGKLVFITEPYGDYWNLALQFSKDMNCDVRKMEGVWFSGTTRYEFTEKG